MQHVGLGICRLCSKVCKRLEWNGVSDKIYHLFCNGPSDFEAEQPADICRISTYSKFDATAITTRTTAIAKMTIVLE